MLMKLEFSRIMGIFLQSWVRKKSGILEGESNPEEGVQEPRLFHTLLPGADTLDKRHGEQSLGSCQCVD